VETAQSNKERQEALRARRLMLGMTEVRGIYLHPDQHAELKAYARKLAKKAEKRGNDPPGSRIESSGSEAD
jgi:glycine/D-amino acid oxidase-like deaminating enzyme